MSRIEKLKNYLESHGKDSFLQHALALEYIKLGNDTEAKLLFEEILNREPSYVGSYYHLGKLLERIGNESEAITIYEKGIIETRKLADRHAQNELQGALDDLIE